MTNLNSDATSEIDLSQFQIDVSRFKNDFKQLLPINVRVSIVTEKERIPRRTNQARLCNGQPPSSQSNTLVPTYSRAPTHIEQHEGVRIKPIPGFASYDPPAVGSDEYWDEEEKRHIAMSRGEPALTHLEAYWNDCESGALWESGWRTSHCIRYYGERWNEVSEKLWQTNAFILKFEKLWNRILFDGRSVHWFGFVLPDVMTRVAEIANRVDLPKRLWRVSLGDQTMDLHSWLTKDNEEVLPINTTNEIAIQNDIADIPEVIFAEWETILSDSEKVLDFLLDRVNSEYVATTAVALVDAVGGTPNENDSVPPKNTNTDPPSIPPLNKLDGTWIEAVSPDMLKLSGLKRSILSAGRSRSAKTGANDPSKWKKHFRSEDMNSGIETGRIWRRDPADPQLIWYLVTSLKKRDSHGSKSKNKRK